MAVFNFPENKRKVRFGIYDHVSGHRIKVLGIVRDVEDHHEMVLYLRLYGDFGLYVEPLSKFKESARIGSARVPKFKYVGE